METLKPHEAVLKKKKRSEDLTAVTSFITEIMETVVVQMCGSFIVCLASRCWWSCSCVLCGHWCLKSVPLLFPLSPPNHMVCLLFFSLFSSVSFLIEFLL